MDHLDIYQESPSSREAILKHCENIGEHKDMIEAVKQKVETTFTNDCADKTKCLEAINTLDSTLLISSLSRSEHKGYCDYIGQFPLKEEFETEQEKKQYENGFLIAYAVSGWLDKDSVDNAEKLLARKRNS